MSLPSWKPISVHCAVSTVASGSRYLDWLGCLCGRQRPNPYGARTGGYGDAGSAQFRYAYKGGKPWVVARTQTGVTTMVGWNENAAVVLNEDSKGDADVENLYARAEALYVRQEKKR